MTTTGAPVHRPAITTTPLTQPWWDAVAKGDLLVQHCEDCGRSQLYPRSICAGCWSDRWEWREASGSGTVDTFSVVHRPAHPAWNEDVPYVIALVRLDEGPVIMTNVIDCDIEAVRVGMAVVCVVTAAPNDPQPLPRFRPVPTG